jgi:hypothetical protein
MPSHCRTCAATATYAYCFTTPALAGTPPHVRSTKAACCSCGTGGLCEGTCCKALLKTTYRYLPLIYSVLWWHVSHINAPSVPELEAVQAAQPVRCTALPGVADPHPQLWLLDCTPASGQTLATVTTGGQMLRTWTGPFVTKHTHTHTPGQAVCSPKATKDQLQIDSYRSLIQSMEGAFRTATHIC